MTRSSLIAAYVSSMSFLYVMVNSSNCDSKHLRQHASCGVTQSAVQISVQNFMGRKIPSMSAGYVFPGGQTSQITLTATTPISTDSCSAVVTVALQKPIAKCNPTLLLSATAGCAAHIGSADLLVTTLAAPRLLFASLVSPSKRANAHIPVRW